MFLRCVPIFTRVDKLMRHFILYLACHQKDKLDAISALKRAETGRDLSKTYRNMDYKKIHS